jgi:hypothetical protein
MCFEPREKLRIVREGAQQSFPAERTYLSLSPVVESKNP